jgi:hypothetical protein
MDEIKYEIRGIIINNYGDILEGVNVTIKYQNNEISTISSNLGQFIFTSNTAPFIKGVDNSLITLTFTKDKYKSLTITLPPPTQTPTPILPTDPTTTDPIRINVLDEVYYVYKVGDIEFKSTNLSVAKKKAYNYYLNLRENQYKQITEFSGGDEIQLEEDIVATITPQTTISGVVLDETGTPLAGATVNIISNPKQPDPEDILEGITTSLTPTSPINETLTTKEDGTWEYKVPTTNVSPKDLSITFSKDEKELKTITNPQQTAFIPETNATVIEIPRITLLTPPDISYTESKKVEQEIKAEENKSLKKQIDTELPPQDKLVNNINLKKEDIKRLLIPFVISLLIPFGAAAVQAVTSKLPIDQIKSLVKCPSASFITNLINKRNKLVRQINNIYSTVKLLTSILAGTTVVISAIQVGINAIGLVPAPPGAPGGTVIAAGKLSKALEKAQITVSVLTLALASFGVILGTIINLLNSLDIILQYCAQDNNMDFEQLNNEINALANPIVIATQSEDNTYKGFALTIKIDQTNESQYIKRYAVATNKQGVDVLKTDSSFASDPAVLISQLKFIIDSNPSITAE